MAHVITNGAAIKIKIGGTTVVIAAHLGEGDFQRDVFMGGGGVIGFGEDVWGAR